MVAVLYFTSLDPLAQVLLGLFSISSDGLWSKILMAVGARFLEKHLTGSIVFYKLWGHFLVKF